MTNRLFICTIILLLSACGSNENSRNTEGAAANEAAQLETTPHVTDSEKETTTANPSNTQKSLGADELGVVTLQIRKEYARIEALINGKQVTSKVLNYDCPDDPQEGSFNFYFRGDTLLKAHHEFIMGDHYGATSNYYFQNGQLIFGFHQSNVWSFADSEADNENPSTKDDIHVQRDYFHQGQLVKQLFKDFTLYSNQKSKSENDFPNKKTGDGVSYVLSGNQVIAFSEKNNLTCEMLNQ